jgi:ParB-like chromosome segregation protein Spo0J
VSAQVEKLDVRTYRVSSDTQNLILRPMRSGRHRWGMFYEGDHEDDTLVVMECDTEKQMIAEGVVAALR